MNTGKQIKNVNGKTYTVLATNGNKAILVGGNDFVVITDLQRFIDTCSWSCGNYFPFFYDENSEIGLTEALEFYRDLNV